MAKIGVVVLAQHKITKFPSTIPSLPSTRFTFQFRIVTQSRRIPAVACMRLTPQQRRSIDMQRKQQCHMSQKKLQYRVHVGVARIANS